MAQGLLNGTPLAKGHLGQSEMAKADLGGREVRDQAGELAEEAGDLLDVAMNSSLGEGHLGLLANGLADEGGVVLARV